MMCESVEESLSKLFCGFTIVITFRNETFAFNSIFLNIYETLRNFHKRSSRFRKIGEIRYFSKVPAVIYYKIEKM